jgi:small subunit ribosomal protein S6
LDQYSKRMYEGMFLVDSAAATSSWDEVEAELQRVFDRADAEVLNLQKWDDRRLCYDIAGHKRGTYILTYFNVDPDRISGIERDVKLNEKLLRVMILRADRIPESIREAPTPYMASMKSAPERVEDEASLDVPEIKEDTDYIKTEELQVPGEAVISDTTETAAPDEAVEIPSGELTEAEASDESKKAEADAADGEST